MIPFRDGGRWRPRPYSGERTRPLTTRPERGGGTCGTGDGERRRLGPRVHCGMPAPPPETPDDGEDPSGSGTGGREDSDDAPPPPPPPPPLSPAPRRSSLLSANDRSTRIPPMERPCSDEMALAAASGVSNWTKPNERRRTGVSIRRPYLEKTAYKSFSVVASDARLPIKTRLLRARGTIDERARGDSPAPGPDRDTVGKAGGLAVSGFTTTPLEPSVFTPLGDADAIGLSSDPVGVPIAGWDSLLILVGVGSASSSSLSSASSLS